MTKLRICVNAGHTKKGAGYGASHDNFKESDINRKVAKELIRLLKAKGHTVYDNTVDTAKTQNEYLKEVVRTVNLNNPDLFISLHCNAGGGNGVEVYTWQGKKLDKAVHICYEMSRLGFRNRGIKDGSDLYVIKRTKPQALLVEMFFLDNYLDRDIYLNTGYKNIAKAICEAI